MTPTAGETSRTWRGQTAEERQADRRERLIEAGIELFGTRGYANTPVKAICEEAGLTERYFYEAFADREALLTAVYDILIADCAKATVEAIEAAGDDLIDSMSAGLRAFAHQLTKDPRRARIQEIESVGVSEALEARRRDAIHAFADLIADRVRAAGEVRDGLSIDVIALGLVGLVNEQLIDFVLGHIDLSLEELVDNQIAVFTAVATNLTKQN
jgi:AcrR family transcriptional regulator